LKVEERGRLTATFEAADDMLWQAHIGRLQQLLPLTLARSGLVGPLVEIAIARISRPNEYRGLVVEPPIFHEIEGALTLGTITGAGVRDRAGVFPLSRFDPSACAANTLWDQWAKHAENAAVASGLPRSLAVSLIGALGELQDNVFEHSGCPITGLVAYGARNGAFEFVVADAGRGVLASLRENSEFSHLADSGTALRIAASDGASRYARSTGHGYGISQVFRALANNAAELRFRSGDHALRLWGDSPSLTGQVELTQKAWLDGLTITVRCATGPVARRKPSCFGYRAA
jgi:hypothetical protein